MVGDPVRGQEVISSWQQYAGWVVMATAPFLGASIDKLGPRKVWLGLVIAAMTPLIAALWWARPDASALTVTATMCIAMLVNVLFAYSEVLHNSLLVRAAGLEGAHKASRCRLATSPQCGRWALRLGHSRCRAQSTGAGYPPRRCSAWIPQPTNPNAWWLFFQPAFWCWVRSRSFFSLRTHRKPALRHCALFAMGRQTFGR
jgi:UMF1 family MFS transporter